MLSIDAWLDERPYREIYEGTIHEKVSPQLPYSRVALRVARLLEDWGGRRGPVGVELRVYLAPGTTLVADVAFISGSRLARLSEQEQRKPPFAPDIVAEVRSPDNIEAEIGRKTALYLAHGATFVLDVDPQSRMIRPSDRDGERLQRSGDAIEHAAFPDLHIPIAEVFATLDQRY